MSELKKLDDQLALQLHAQGQVSSLPEIVSELVQNSIDADAVAVTVEVDFVKFEVKCRDNGVGVASDMLDQVGRRNFTSKCNTADDLASVSTLGFRGEALYSIGLQSYIKFTSKVRDASTYSVAFGGQTRTSVTENKLQPIQRSGTLVSVAGIFGHIPVRRRALRQIPKESMVQRIKVLLAALSMASPKVSISAIETNAGRFFSVVAGFITEHSNIPRSIRVIRSVTGSDMVASWEPVTCNYDSLDLSGMIVRQGANLSACQIIVMNRRLVEDPRVYKLLNDQLRRTCYGRGAPSLASKRCHPVYALSIRYPMAVDELLQDPSKRVTSAVYMRELGRLFEKLAEETLERPQGDVSVHTRSGTLDHPVVPATRATMHAEITAYREVRSMPESDGEESDEEFDFDTVTGPVAVPPIIEPLSMQLPARVMTAMTDDVTSEPTSEAISFEILRSRHRLQAARELERAFPSRRTNGIYIDRANPIPCRAKLGCEAYGFILNELQPYFSMAETEQFRKVGLSQCNVVGQVGDVFILGTMQAENMTVVLLVDQHAADERVRYEELLDKTFATEAAFTPVALKYRLLIWLTEGDLQPLEDFRPYLEQWGIRYTIEGAFMVITHIPTFAEERCEDQEYVNDLVLVYVRQVVTGDIPKLLRTPGEHWSSFTPFCPRVILEGMATRACHTACRAGLTLTAREAKEIIEKLSHCKFPFTCAHGRPSIIPALRYPGMTDHQLVNAYTPPPAQSN